MKSFIRKHKYVRSSRKIKKTQRKRTQKRHYKKISIRRKSYKMRGG